MSGARLASRRRRGATDCDVKPVSTVWTPQSRLLNTAMPFPWLASVLSLSLLAVASANEAKNILMIVVDDLRPQIKAYGVPWMVTPHIDKLASQGEQRISVCAVLCFEL